MPGCPFVRTVRGTIPSVALVFESSLTHDGVIRKSLTRLQLSSDLFTARARRARGVSARWDGQGEFQSALAPQPRASHLAPCRALNSKKLFEADSYIPEKLGSSEP